MTSLSVLRICSRNYFCPNIFASVFFRQKVYQGNQLLRDLRRVTWSGAPDFPPSNPPANNESLVESGNKSSLIRRNSFGKNNVAVAPREENHLSPLTNFVAFDHKQSKGLREITNY